MITTIVITVIVNIAVAVSAAAAAVAVAVAVVVVLVVVVVIVVAVVKFSLRPSFTDGPPALFATLRLHRVRHSAAFAHSQQIERFRVTLKTRNELHVALKSFRRWKIDQLAGLTVLIGHQRWWTHGARITVIVG